MYHTIYSLCTSYNTEVNQNNIEDFESKIKLYLIVVIDRTNLNVDDSIVKYKN